jgi:hypothetical protein
VLVAVVLFPRWRSQAVACAVLNGALLLLWPLLPESGRWLLVQGRQDDALKVHKGPTCVTSSNRVLSCTHSGAARRHDNTPHPLHHGVRDSVVVTTPQPVSPFQPPPYLNQAEPPNPSLSGAPVLCTPQWDVHARPPHCWRSASSPSSWIRLGRLRALAAAAALDTGRRAEGLAHREAVRFLVCLVVCDLFDLLRGCQEGLWGGQSWRRGGITHTLHTRYNLPMTHAAPSLCTHTP